jgi:hypothetical protein
MRRTQMEKQERKTPMERERRGEVRRVEQRTGKPSVRKKRGLLYRDGQRVGAGDSLGVKIDAESRGRKGRRKGSRGERGLYIDR